MKQYNRNENLKINEISDFKINLKIFNKNNKVYKKKNYTLKNLS